MPAGSRMDSLLTRAEPISDGGNASGVTCFRRGKSSCATATAADTKVIEEGGGGDAPGTGAEIPLQAVVKTLVRQASPLQLVEVNVAAYIHLQPTGNAPGTGAEIPLQAVVKTLVRQAAPLQLVEVNVAAYIHLQPTGNTPPGQVDAQRRLRAHAGGGSWQDLWTEDQPRSAHHRNEDLLLF
ncbi:protein pxr1-like [Limosa lapponica baueri]|uniref:Protein pxr1-like n=1 Tax=Limosa lapponica baueri TaxID=1758121 RepID=A0A2I0UG53_LIMLA|nr:protein pxr1-like [Limosa lapponica baueri]